MVRQGFADQFTQIPVPHRNAARKLVDKFRVTGSVDNAKCYGRPAKLWEEKLLDISDSLQLNPRKSLLKKVSTEARW